MKQESKEIKLMVVNAKGFLADVDNFERCISQKSWKEMGYTKTEMSGKVKYAQGCYQGLVIAISFLLGYNTADVNLMIRNWEKFND